MAEGKWITGLTPDMPADEAARVVLAVRLSAVRHYLALAADRAAEDVEYVHQLRVATRRAGAALRIFQQFLFRKSYRKARRVLRELRRAAGEARDWDVFLGQLREVSSPNAEFLAGYALRERLAAQRSLIATAAEQIATVHALCASISSATRSIADSEPAPTLRQHAATVMGELFALFVKEVRANPTTTEELHQLRITAKRVRYAMEVFAGIHAKPFREVLYPEVEELQEILGGVQDAMMTTSRLERIDTEFRYLPAELAARLHPGIATLAGDTRPRISRGDQEFRRWAERWEQLNGKHPLAELSMPSSS